MRLPVRRKTGAHELLENVAAFLEHENSSKEAQAGEGGQPSPWCGYGQALVKGLLPWWGVPIYAENLPTRLRPAWKGRRVLPNI